MEWLTVNYKDIQGKEKCFTCNLSKCKDCLYRLDNGYAVTKKGNMFRSHESWNRNHPNDLMPQTGYEIHHRDYTPLNDSIENLKKLTKSEHRRLHMELYWNGLSDEEYKERCEKMKGNQNSLGCKHLEETNEKNRQASLGNHNGKGWPEKLTFTELEEYKVRVSKRMKGKQNALNCKHSEEVNEAKRKRMKLYWKDIRSGKRIRKVKEKKSCVGKYIALDKYGPKGGK